MSKLIAINTNIGGFGISLQALQYMGNLGSEHAKACLENLYSEDKLTIEDLIQHNDFVGYSRDYGEFNREDPLLIQTIQDLGIKSFSAYSKLKIVEIPDDVEYYIEDNDGYECIHEEHRIWN